MAYQWIEALHVIAVIAWMAGMLYLPRLFVYHVGAAQGSEMTETFKTMERRLLRVIINPAMIATFVFGIWMIVMNPDLLHQGWLHGKLALVAGMVALHVMLARWRRAFAEDRNIHSAKFYRVINEVPTLLMIGIVILVMIKPF